MRHEWQAPLRYRYVASVLAATVLSGACGSGSAGYCRMASDDTFQALSRALIRLLVCGETPLSTSLLPSGR
jgi:hypothetical protein